ncbi:response regulator transcription factor, partial [Cysteiniphilum sp. SYW-8]
QCVSPIIVIFQGKCGLMMNGVKFKILIVDDDEIIREELQEILQAENYEVCSAANPVEADVTLETFLADLLIVDLNMPGYENGKYYCRRISEKLRIPVIIITASEDELDELISYELGALQFMQKPFSTRVLLAKIRNILSMSKVKSSEDEKIWQLDMKELQLINLEQKLKISLNINELKLLSYLNEHIGSSSSQYDIAKYVYGRDLHPEDRIVSTLISRFRQKLKDNNCEYLIGFTRGLGYSLKYPIQIK